MSYAYTQSRQMGTNRTFAIIIVAIVHVMLGYALITGLAYNVIKQATGELKTFNVEEEFIPPPEEPPPSPPETVPDIPSPVVSPPPIVRTKAAPSVVQTVKDAPPPVVTPRAAPAPPAPPAPPRYASACASASASEDSCATECERRSPEAVPRRRLSSKRSTRRGARFRHREPHGGHQRPGVSLQYYVVERLARIGPRNLPNPAKPSEVYSRPRQSRQSHDGYGDPAYKLGS